MNILMICAFALAALAVILPLKQIKAEYALFASAAVSLLILNYVLDGASDLTRYLEYLSASGNARYFIVVLKAMGITFLGYITSEICRDFGENSLGNKVELAAKIGVLFVTMPVFDELFGFVNTVLG